jgi:hypothetical protein
MTDTSAQNTDYTPLFLLAVALWICYKFYMRLRVAGSERRAKNLIAAFDNEVQLSLAEIVDNERAANGLGAIDGERRRFRPQRSRDMSCALAHEAYMEFGYRPRSDANLIITRKFMRDLLLEYKDLRARDARGIIDVALYLSFLPSAQLREMNELDRTSTFVERTADVPGVGSWWLPNLGSSRAGGVSRWWPFGHREHA